MASYVAVPVKDNLDLTRDLIGALMSQGGFEAVFVLDNGSTDGTAMWLESVASPRLVAVDCAGMSLPAMWNAGVDLARDRMGGVFAGNAVAVLNNDIRVGPCFVEGLERALGSRADLWAVSPNYDGRPGPGVDVVTGTFKEGGLAGFAFMARADVFERIRFDESFEWWFADDDFVAQVEALGGRVGVAREVGVEHIGGGSQTVRYTRPVLSALDRDRRRMWEKWRRW